MSGTGPEVLFSRTGGLGLITLNRPRALNALTVGMLRAVGDRLQVWAKDDSIGVVLIQGGGERAFCAGGDIRSLYDDRAAADGLRRDMYRAEYPVNRAIFRYPKPYVALMDGVTMGGGVGLSVHGAQRVVTERTLFAMPEASIGFFPDVGGSYFLSRCPGQIGMYLALTGARLKAADCLYAGVGTHYLPAAEQPALVDVLADADAGRVGAVLDALAKPLGTPPLAAHRQAIDRCFSADSVGDILARLELEGSDWSRRTADVMRRNSPTSMKVSFRQLRLGLGMDFDAAMIMEYRLSQAFMAGHDFFEGVRAVIVDKDQAPRWRPARLEDVSDADVEGYFTSRIDDLTFN